MPATMQALAALKHGPLAGLALIELPIPEPGRGEVRVKVAASSVNPADAKTLTGQTGILHAPGFPQVTGWDVSGVVDALGAGVSGLSVGQAVFGFHRYSRSTRQGAFAQFTVLPAAGLAPKPEGVGHDVAAAAATTGLTALQAFRGAKLAAGQRVLVTGASGGVGSIAIGVAQRLGATVDAVSSPAHLAAVAALGAATVWDRSTDAWKQQALGRYDVILDAAAAYSYGALRRLLKPGGRYITTLPSLSLLTDLLPSRLRGQKNGFVMVDPNTVDLTQLGAWLADGLAVPIAQRYPLAQAPEAIARSVKPDFLGKLVVSLDTNGL